MKNRFSTLDLRASIAELQQKYQGMRVMNVYDVDSKTYLIKLAKPDMKAMILLESGIRIHSTDFVWPKNITPSSFSMKMRKHLRTRRLEKIEQLGIDRIIDIQFGSGEAAYHVILELYDRGNIVLTNHEYMILNILRPRTDQSEDVRFAVNEKYPVDTAKQPGGLIAYDEMVSILMGAKIGDNLKKTLNPKLVYGPALIEHVLELSNFSNSTKIGKEFNISEDVPKLMVALEQAEHILQESKNSCKGYIIQKKEKKPAMKDGELPEELLTYSEFHPFLFKQHENLPYVELESFDKAVDQFFSQIGSQKLDMKILQQERAAMKKLDHIKVDHEKRLHGLKQEQGSDMNKAALIEMNLELVDRAIVVIRSAIANQIDWQEINNIVKEAQAQNDPVASAIKALKLNINHMTMFLRHPYLDSDEEDADEEENITPMKVDIDLELSAYANARKYYDMKRKAASKEQKTVDASAKAFKSAQKKTFQTLKEVQTVATINKARKTHWFEKFLWFISSENYIVIGGRDQQQNEYIVKKYMRPGDLYVHADLHGASSVIIKNPTGAPVPPKTLNEAGTMALCNSAAWDARVVTSAWWVYHHQVTKTAPSGEYLTTGSFMIRGKKNFLPPSYLIYGFGFMFKVDEDSVFRHKDERRVRTLDDDSESVKAESVSTDTTAESQEQELDDVDSSDSEDDSTNNDKHSTDGSKTEDTSEQNTEESLPGEVSHLKITDNLESESVQDPGHVSVDVNIVDAVTDQKDAAETMKDNEDEEDEEEDEDAMFPDTNIDLQYVQGEKLRVQVSRTTSRTMSTGSTEMTEDVDTGNAESLQQKKGGAKLSAKQRREMRRRKGKEVPNLEEAEVVQNVITEETPNPLRNTLDEAEAPTEQKQKIKQDSQTEPPARKRGQKAKLKKMKEKYADQDEEERQLRMDILGSAGAPKEEKKKGKKGKQHGATKKQLGQGPSQPGQGPTQSGQGSQGHKPHRKLTIDDIKEESPIATDGNTPGIKEGDALSDEEKQTLLEEENIQIGQDINELDSLTGIPHPEDLLHFCIPVCGPYSAMINYKYRVKLTPGNTKRGKAAKTAVNSFQHDRTATNREKDLFKSLKDVDLSRNVPGKVKVSAPNLLKSKKK